MSLEISLHQPSPLPSEPVWALGKEVQNPQRREREEGLEEVQGGQNVSVSLETRTDNPPTPRPRQLLFIPARVCKQFKGRRLGVGSLSLAKREAAQLGPPDT